MTAFENPACTAETTNGEKLVWTRPELKVLVARNSEAGILNGPEILILLS